MQLHPFSGSHVAAVRSSMWVNVYDTARRTDFACSRFGLRPKVDQSRDASITSRGTMESRNRGGHGTPSASVKGGEALQPPARYCHGGLAPPRRMTRPVSPRRSVIAESELAHSPARAATRCCARRRAANGFGRCIRAARWHCLIYFGGHAHAGAPTTALICP